MVLVQAKSSLLKSYKLTSNNTSTDFLRYLECLPYMPCQIKFKQNFKLHIIFLTEGQPRIIFFLLPTTKVYVLSSQNR